MGHATQTTGYRVANRPCAQSATRPVLTSDQSLRTGSLTGQGSAVTDLHPFGLLLWDAHAPDTCRASPVCDASVASGRDQTPVEPPPCHAR